MAQQGHHNRLNKFRISLFDEESARILYAGKAVMLEYSSMVVMKSTLTSGDDRRHDE